MQTNRDIILCLEQVAKDEIAFDEEKLIKQADLVSNMAEGELVRYLPGIVTPAISKDTLMVKELAKKIKECKTAP